MITFISGGARSGKSEVAEQKAKQLVQQRANQLTKRFIKRFTKKGAQPFVQLAQALSRDSAPKLVYLATGRASDAEMGDRILHHQRRRGEDWLTKEGTDITLMIMSCPDHSVILWDCLTTWLDAVMFQQEKTREEIEREMEQMLQLARDKWMDLIIVSNDINEDVLPGYTSVHQYVYQLEALHRSIITQADSVIQVRCGLPFVWKEGRGSQE